ncbi:MAG TPA: prepilin-type N-terminal cleavage/methylation domain-containing protein [Fimbriiglobus sp.]|nr:prepilin-type N-terminal cleavage/methylation domain-containing protein [Fimbriiglobus sp.]
MKASRSPGSSRRAGYTLLEVLLASVLAVILLAALYATLDVTLLRMDVGREMVAGNNLSRAVVNRMGADLTGVLGPMPPKSGGGSSSTTPSTSSPESSESQTGGSTPATSDTGTGTETAAAETTTGIEGDTTSPDAQAVFAADVPVQAGVIGTDRQFTVFMSRVPESLVNPEAIADPTLLLPGDQRRVTYYLASGGTGLCRQERPWVTADGVRNSVDPDYTTEATDLIAPEVVDVTFEYLDATTGEYLTSWDGGMTGADGVTPTGPPRAIRATFVLEFLGPGGGTIQKQIQHVFPVRSAVGTYVPPTEGTETTDPATTTGGM